MYLFVALGNAIFLLIFSINIVQAEQRLDYRGFSLWIDCEKRSAVKFRYTARKDHGYLPRHRYYSLDPSLSKECQQFTERSYRGLQSNAVYDRGHLVPANHLDNDKLAIQQTNYMTNIVPQTIQLNRGAWLATEEIVECYRDIGPIIVIGGVLWTGNKKNDHFIESHGIKTPDAFWKVLISRRSVIAWLFPNTKQPSRARLDDYLVSINFIEALTGESFDVPIGWKNRKPYTSWSLPGNCDKG